MCVCVCATLFTHSCAWLLSACVTSPTQVECLRLPEWNIAVFAINPKRRNEIEVGAQFPLMPTAKYRGPGRTLLGFTLAHTHTRESHDMAYGKFGNDKNATGINEIMRQWLCISHMTNFFFPYSAVEHRQSNISNSAHIHTLHVITF